MRKSEIDAMSFENGRIIGFKLRFRSYDDDYDRYITALVELDERGLVPLEKGQTLYGQYCQDLWKWVAEFYFKENRLDQLEQHFTPTEVMSIGPMYEAPLAIVDRFKSMGEDARVRRMWRAHAGLIKAEFWWHIKERDAGFQMVNYKGASEKAQRRDYEKLVKSIPGLKKKLLRIMSDYRDAVKEAGASSQELASIDADIHAIEEEQRPRPKGKPDPQKMNEDLFWTLIDEGLPDQPIGERLVMLPDRLAAFKAAEIRGFEVILRELDARAYRWDVWALAYLLQGGCSDDSFEEFRGWLILQGRKVFEATLSDPDGFDVSLHSGMASGMSRLRDIAPIAYEMRAGKSMKPVKPKTAEVAGTEIADEDCAKALPRIADLVGA